MAAAVSANYGRARFEFWKSSRYSTLFLTWTALYYLSGWSTWQPVVARVLSMKDTKTALKLFRVSSMFMFLRGALVPTVSRKGPSTPNSWRTSSAASLRGIGTIPASGLRLRDAYADYDAVKIFGLADITAEEPAECISAQVLQGLKKPTDCSAFGARCTPENPLGAPMVSSEGACAAYYHYRRHTANT